MAENGMQQQQEDQSQLQQPELQFAASVPQFGGQGAQFAASVPQFAASVSGGEEGGVPRMARERTADSVKVFIGQIPRNATEADLLPLLQPYGTLQELAIVKDKATNVSRGCGFAVYSTRNEANAAIQGLHNAHVMPGMSNPIQVSIANGEQERLAENKLFAGMISKTATEQEVQALFSSFGNIEEIHILRDKQTNESKGCAFIKYELRSAALAAIETLNGRHQMPGAPQPMVVKFADSKKPTMMKPAMPMHQQHHHMGVNPFGMGGMLPGGMMQDQRHMQQFNQFAQQGWAPTQQWGQHGMATNFGGNGFGMYGAQGHPGGVADERKEAGPPGANLFVYHIPPTFTDADLAATFQPFGPLVSAKVYMDRNTGESKGFGFVSYDNPTSAEAAISHMNGFQIGSKRLKVQHKKVHGQPGRPY